MKQKFSKKIEVGELVYCHGSYGEGSYVYGVGTPDYIDPRITFITNNVVNIVVSKINSCNYIISNHLGIYKCLSINLKRIVSEVKLQNG